MQAYSNPKRENDPHALPDVEVFQLTATEVAAMDEDLVWEYGKRREFRLASMNSRDREAMLDAIVAEEGIEGGWFWWTCLGKRFLVRAITDTVDEANTYMEGHRDTALIACFGLDSETEDTSASNIIQKTAN